MPVGAARFTRSQLPQQWRLAAALAYMLALLGLARYLNGTFWPPYGLDGLWFYAAAAALLLGEFLLEPFFTRPADALANAVAVLIATATVSLDGADIPLSDAQAGRNVAIVVSCVLIALAVAAIALKDTGGRVRSVAGLSAAIVARLGRARVLFSALLFASGYAAFADSAGRVAVLYLAWFVILVVEPVESLVVVLLRRQASRPADHGIVTSLEDPGVVVARLPKGLHPLLGTRVTLNAETLGGTVVDATELTEEPMVRIALDKPEPVRLGARVVLSDGIPSPLIIGQVGEGTTLEELCLSVLPTASEGDLEEGRLVEVGIGDTPTLFQIVSAEIIRRTDEALNRRLVRVRARKLGRWDSTTRAFSPVSWVPFAGAPVRLVAVPQASLSARNAVGYVPGTPYEVCINPHLLVTHNAAILGILGIGKTHLAWELIDRQLAEGIRVVVLDITGRYAARFAHICSSETQEAIAAQIDEACRTNVANRAVRNDEAGNIEDFRTALGRTLDAFAASTARLLILNPNRFEISRMDGRPFNKEANMLARVSMVDVTRMVSEKLLEISQSATRDPNDERATLCLVLEEGHSLVPEWNSATNDSDRQSVNGTARAILQGRKYGYGCLVVTQRTANVTKSILNQCNTIFGLRVFDATGMGFLENYIGPTHSQLLASLRDRQAIVFGRASSCNAPIVVNLNDSAVFQTDFAEALAGVPATRFHESQAGAPIDGPLEADQDDDIPF